MSNPFQATFNSISHSNSEAFLLDPGKTVHEIWTSDFEGNRLVLGADEKAVYYPDLGSSQSLDRPRVLKTGSDVFSTCFHGEVRCASSLVSAFRMRTVQRVIN